MRLIYRPYNTYPNGLYNHKGPAEHSEVNTVTSDLEMAGIYTDCRKGVIHMTKPELVDAVAEKTGMKKKDASVAVEAILDSIAESLNKKEQVSLVGFGTFDVRAREERMGRNPRTGEQITIPASTACVFRPGRKLKEAVSG